MSVWGFWWRKNEQTIAIANALKKVLGFGEVKVGDTDVVFEAPALPTNDPIHVSIDDFLKALNVHPLAEIRYGNFFPYPFHVIVEITPTHYVLKPTVVAENPLPLPVEVLNVVADSGKGEEQEE